MRCFPSICSNVCGCIADVMLMCTLVPTFSMLQYSLYLFILSWSVVCNQ